MRLLVSVTDVGEARTALAAGADIIDAKNPRRGSLGAVTPRTLRAIVGAVRAHRPVSAALGDALSTSDLRQRVRQAAASGASFVKVGFRRVTTDARALRLAVAAQDACAIGPATTLVLVAYADAERADSPSPNTLVGAAARCGASGVLLDTCLKDTGGLFEVLPFERVIAWVALAHDQGLRAGLAGGLGARDLALAEEAGADLVGVRGAACDGGRNGRVSASCVARLHAALRATARPARV
jgi:uncharacterized protein (UPF0264 family)